MVANRTAGTAFRRKATSPEGATAIEYAIMVSLIAVVIIFAVYLIGQQLQSTYDCTEDHVANTPNEPIGGNC